MSKLSNASKLQSVRFTRENLKIPTTAAEFDVPVRLRKRMIGRPWKLHNVLGNMRLGLAEEAGLCCYLDRLAEVGMAPRLPHLTHAANLALQEKNSNATPLPVVSAMWT